MEDQIIEVRITEDTMYLEAILLNAWLVCFMVV